MQTIKQKNAGFTLMELLVAIAIIGILATITVPSMLKQRLRSEIKETIRVTAPLRDDITNYYYGYQTFPEDNKQANQPEPEKLIGNRYSRIDIEDGVLHITLGNKANKTLHGKVISIRPATVINSPASPIAWVCGYEEPVEGMQARGKNRTDLDKDITPVSCGL